jgi:hypothetical protein
MASRVRLALAFKPVLLTGYCLVDDGDTERELSAGEAGAATRNRGTRLRPDGVMDRLQVKGMNRQSRSEASQLRSRRGVRGAHRLRERELDSRVGRSRVRASIMGSEGSRVEAT